KKGEPIGRGGCLTSGSQGSATAHVDHATEARPCSPTASAGPRVGRRSTPARGRGHAATHRLELRRHEPGGDRVPRDIGRGDALPGQEPRGGRVWADRIRLQY